MSTARSMTSDLGSAITSQLKAGVSRVVGLGQFGTGQVLWGAGQGE